MNDRDDAGTVRDVSRVFSEIIRGLQELQSEGWSGVDLTMAQFKTLMLIAATGGLPGRELAHRLNVGPSAVTPIIDKLVHHGYVRREEDGADRRLCWARPTPAGLAFFEGIHAAGREGLEKVLALLASAEVAQIQNAFDLLHRAVLSRIDELKKEQYSQR